MPVFFRPFYTTILLLGICISKANAQTSNEETTQPTITLRLNPFSLLEADGNIMVGIGYKFHHRWAVTFDPGFIFYSPFANINNISSESGIKIRSDVRFLFDRSKAGRFSSFIGPEFHYKYVEAKKWEDFGINCINGQCAYFQREEYKEIKREIGGSIKVGTLVRLSTRWNIELYGGLGVKFYKFSQADIPIGGTFLDPPNQNPFFNTARNPVQVMAPVGAKVVFQIK